MSRNIVAVVVLCGLCSASCIERWAYVELQSVPAGAKVRTKGLKGDYALGEIAAPAGHFLRCTVDAANPDLRVTEDAWSYVFSLHEHNDEEVFVERAQLAKVCTDSREAAQKNPHRINATLLAISSEEGLSNAVLITTSPSGATVFDDTSGEVLGKTPLRRTYLFFAPYKKDYPLRLEQEGYVTLKHSVTVSTLVLHSNMHRPGEAPPPQPPPKTKRRTPHEDADPPDGADGSP